ncbi:MAG: hypothetical protein WCB18_01260 [Thermoplasmata archaeon]
MATLFASNRVFGGDVAEYLFTSHGYLHGASNLFSYPYPLLPALYLPLVSAVPGMVASFQLGDLTSGIALLFFCVGIYALALKLTRSTLAAVLAAAACGTQPFLMTEVGWTGIAQFVAFGLGALGLVFLVATKESPSLKLTWAGGGLFLLAVLAEPYSAGYFVVAAAIYVLGRWRLGAFRPEFVVRMSPLFAPSIAAVAYLSFLHPQIAATGLADPVLLHIQNLSNWGLMIGQFDGNNSYLLGLYGLTAIFYVLVRGQLQKSIPIDSWALRALFAALLVQVLLLTPYATSTRGPYFLVIPLGLLIGRLSQLLSLLPQDSLQPTGQVVASEASGGLPRAAESKEVTPPADLTTPFDSPENRRPSTMSGRLLSRMVVVGVALAVVVVGFQLGVSSASYPAAINFYGESTSQLQELTWLRAEVGGVLYIAPNPSTFPIVFATQRPVFPLVQPLYFTSADQRSAAALAWALASGVNWLQGGQVEFVDAAPAWAQPSPGLFVDEYPYDVQLLRTGDGLIFATYSPASNPAIVYTVSPFYAPARNTTVVGDSIVDTYQWQYLTLTKTLSMEPDGSANMTLGFAFHQAVPQSLQIRVVSPQAKVSEVQVASENGNSSARILQSFSGGSVPASYSTNETVQAVGLRQTTQFIATDQYGLPEVRTTLNVTGSPTTTYTVYVHFSVSGLSASSPSAVTESEALTSSGIRWVVINKASDTNYINRFVNDPTFILYSQSAHYDFFKVA